MFSFSTDRLIETAPRSCPAASGLFRVHYLALTKPSYTRSLIGVGFFSSYGNRFLTSLIKYKRTIAS